MVTCKKLLFIGILGALTATSLFGMKAFLKLIPGDNEVNASILFELITENDVEDVYFIHLFKQSKLNQKIKNKEGNTLLHEAAAKDFSIIVQFLCKKASASGKENSIINAVNNAGQTPLDLTGEGAKSAAILGEFGALHGSKVGSRFSRLFRY